MKKTSLMLSAIAAFTMLSTSAFAGISEPITVSAKVGTLGLGMDVSYPVTSNISVRGNINYFTYSTNEVLSDVPYDASVDFFTVGVLADYYPFESGFRISGGAYYNDNSADAAATPGLTEEITIGDNVYTGSDIGSMTTDISFDEISPYIGIGYGMKSDNGLSFNVDLGAMYQGSPLVGLNVIPNSSLPADVQEQIRIDAEKEIGNIEDELEDYSWYPVVSIGISYSF